MNLQKTYIFNPFNIKNATLSDVAGTYTAVLGELHDDPNSLYEYSNNIEIYANLNYLIGEMLARSKKELVSAKNTLKIEEAKALVDSKKQFKIDNPTQKMPAVDHFKAIAIDRVKEHYLKLTDIEGTMLRYKTTFETNEQLQNALKKKMEAIKYEEFNK